MPGFTTLVGGPVTVDRLLAEGDTVEFGGVLTATVIHTPGHSAGSISLWVEGAKVLITGDAVLLPGDAVLLPGDLPIFDDIVVCAASLRKLQALEGVEYMLSSWEAPVIGRAAVRTRMDNGLEWLGRVHAAVHAADAGRPADAMELCRKVVAALGLPPAAANPLVARSLVSCLKAGKDWRR